MDISRIEPGLFCQNGTYLSLEYQLVKKGLKVKVEEIVGALVTFRNEDYSKAVNQTDVYFAGIIVKVR